MKSNINHTPLRTYSSIEEYVKRYKNPYNLRPKQAGYHLLPWTEHYKDGWRYGVIPTLGENQRLGSQPYYDAQADVVTYPVIDITEEELKQQVINQIESNREELIQKEIKEKAIKEIQLKEGSEALKYKYAYPLWEIDMLCKLNHKYTYIEADKTISLYKCLIEHPVDGTRIPPLATTYFTKVTESIIPWTAGINAQKDRLYSFAGKNYRCLENHLTVAGQDPTKAKAYWVEEKV